MERGGQFGSGGDGHGLALSTGALQYLEGPDLSPEATECQMAQMELDLVAEIIPVIGRQQEQRAGRAGRWIMTA